MQPTGRIMDEAGTGERIEPGICRLKPPNTVTTRGVVLGDQALCPDRVAVCDQIHRRG